MGEESIYEPAKVLSLGYFSTYFNKVVKYYYFNLMGKYVNDTLHILC